MIGTDFKHEAWIVFIGMQESQGFTRSSSNTRLVYDFEGEDPNSSIESENLQNVEEEEEEGEVWFCIDLLLML